MKLIFSLLIFNSALALDAVLIQTENSDTSLPILQRILEKNYNIPSKLIKTEQRACDLSDALIHFCLKDDELKIMRLNRTFYQDNFLQFMELNEERKNETI